MPFVARCPFCSKEFRAADTMEGRSVTCKQCGDAFTLAKAEKLPASSVAKAQPPAPSIVPVSKPPEAVQPIEFDPTPLPRTRSLPALAEALEGPSETPKPAPPPKAAGSRRSWADELPIFGVASLALLGVALLLLSFPSLRFATIGVAGLAILAGLIGWFAANGGRKRMWMPLAGAVLSIPVLVVAIFFPQLLAVRPPEEVKLPVEDPAKILAVPFRGTAIDATSEWIDASRYSIQQGDLRVRVLSVVIGPVELSSKTASRSQQPYLQIKLEIANARVRKRLDYLPWSRGDGIVLRDQTGKTYALKSLGGEVAGQQKNSVALGPFDRVTDLLIFESPPAKTVEHLRLELPASAAGGIGSLKFEIPPLMIQRH